MINFKKILFSRWHFMRWLRLLVSILISSHAIFSEQYFFLFFAGYFLFQAVFDTCGLGSCDVKFEDSKVRKEN